MKLGISIKIDVTKIDKARLFKGKKGTYMGLTAFVNIDEKDDYNNNGFITQSPTEQERQKKTKMPILGNVWVFWTEGGNAKPHQKPGENVPAAEYEPDDSDIPF